MSEIKPDDPRGGPKHVDSRIVGEEPPVVERDAPPAPTGEPTEIDTIPSPTGEELVAAKYYAIAFLAIVIPLGLLLLGLVTISFVRSLDFLK